MDLFSIDHELVAFLVACVATARKYFPKIDGAYVPIVALVMALLLCVGTAAQRQDATLQMLLGAALLAFKSTLAAVGGTEFLKWGASKFGGAQ